MQHKALSALLALAVLMSGFGFAFAGLGTAQDVTEQSQNDLTVDEKDYEGLDKGTLFDEGKDDIFDPCRDVPPEWQPGYCA